jgi:hypothetical protein
MDPTDMAQWAQGGVAIGTDGIASIAALVMTTR